MAFVSLKECSNSLLGMQRQEKLDRARQTYLHLTVHASESQLATARSYFEYVAAVSAAERFQQDVYLDFRIEDGSLKGWLTVLGGIYAAISAYGSLRSGIDYLVSDARAFSQRIIDEAHDEIGIPQGAFYRSERRLGLPGRIQRLFPLLDETSTSIQEGDDVKALQNLHRVQERIKRIADELEEPEEQKVLQALYETVPDPLRKRLPEPTQSIPTPIHVARQLPSEQRRTRGRRPKDILAGRRIRPTPPRFL